MLTWKPGYHPSPAVVACATKYGNGRQDSVVFVDGNNVMLLDLDIAHEYTGEMQPVGRWDTSGSVDVAFDAVDGQLEEQLERALAVVRDREQTIDRLVEARDKAIAANVELALELAQYKADLGDAFAELDRKTAPDEK